MKNGIASKRRDRLSVSLLLFCFFTTAGCGLAMSNQDLVNRVAKSYLNGDFRAAITDAKSELLDEPYNLAAHELLGRASVEIGDGISGKQELLREIDMETERATVLADLSWALSLQQRFDVVLRGVNVDYIIDDGSCLAVLRLQEDASCRLKNYPDLGFKLLSNPVEAAEPRGA